MARITGADRCLVHSQSICFGKRCVGTAGGCWGGGVFGREGETAVRRNSLVFFLDAEKVASASADAGVDGRILAVVINQNRPRGHRIGAGSGRIRAAQTTVIGISIRSNTFIRFLKIGRRNRSDVESI